MDEFKPLIVGRATPGARAADASMPPDLPGWSASVTGFAAVSTASRVRFT